MVAEPVPSPSPPSGLRNLLAQDARASRRYQESRFGYRPATWWLDPGFVAVALHRLGRWARLRGHGFLARLLTQANTLVTGAEIPADSAIGPGLLLPTPLALCLSGHAGRDLTMLALTGVGSRMREDDAAAGGALPVLGDGVSMGFLSGIMKAVRIGDGATIAPGAGALFDMPAGSRGVSAVAPQAGDPPPVPKPRPHALPPCDHGRWSATWRDYRADIDRTIAEMQRFGTGPASFRLRLRTALFSPLVALLTYRIAHWLHLRGLRRIARACALLNRLFHKVTIVPQACLGGGAFLPHLAGTLINARAGRNLTLYANTVCAPWHGAHAPLDEAPQLGDDVRIGAHGAIIGPVDIGDRVFLAMKVNLFDTVPGGQGVFSPMARVQLGEAQASPAQAPALPEPGAWSADALRRGDAQRRAAWMAQGRRIGLAGRIAVALYRRSHAHHAAGRLRRARWAWLANVYCNGIDIAPMSRIGPGLLIDAPAGIAFHGCAGRDLTLMAQTIVGAELTADRRSPSLEAAPILGDGITLHPHAVVAGRIAVGDRTILYPGCTALSTVPSDVTLMPRPPRLRPVPEAR